MKTIKIGRKTYEIKPGDYILYNESCYQFCAGDNRTLLFDGWDKRFALRIPKSRLKEIPFDKMRKTQNKNLTYWYF